MYQLVKISDKSYHIVLRDKTIGRVDYIEKKWTAFIGKTHVTASSRKKAVEGAIFQIISGYLGGLYGINAT